MAECQLLSWPQGGRHRTAEWVLRALSLGAEKRGHAWTAHRVLSQKVCSWHWRAEERIAWGLESSLGKGLSFRAGHGWHEETWMRGKQGGGRLGWVCHPCGLTAFLPFTAHLQGRAS